MGFLSRLLKDGAADAALNKLKNAAQNVLGEVNPAAAPAAPPQTKPASPVMGSGPWGESMPAEENQYSFNGTYVQYFEAVYRAEFPNYRITFEPGADRRSTVVTFFDGERQALVVELKSEQSSAQKLRRACAAAGTPYLRFYYDHNGWWNTRSYVTERTRRALNG